MKHGGQMCKGDVKAKDNHFFKSLAECLFPLFLHSQKRKGFIFVIRIKDSVAQLVEQYTFNVWVLGSSPSGITKRITFTGNPFFFLHHLINDG